mgnify:CR=1 FL=1
MKRIVGIAFALVLSLATSFLAGYYTTLKYVERNKDILQEKAIEDELIENTAKLPDLNIIGPSTEIVLRERYLKGVEYNRDIIEKASSEVVGMNKTQAEEYFKSKGYTVIDFSNKRVLAVKDILDEWPKGCYVVKEQDGFVAIFQVDKSGELKLVKLTDLNVEDLPDGDKEEVKKGKVFESLEDAMELIEEYTS